MAHLEARGFGSFEEESAGPRRRRLFGEDPERELALDVDDLLSNASAPPSPATWRARIVPSVPPIISDRSSVNGDDISTTSSPRQEPLFCKSHRVTSPMKVDAELKGTQTTIIRHLHRARARLVPVSSSRSPILFASLLSLLFLAFTAVYFATGSHSARSGVRMSLAEMKPTGKPGAPGPWVYGGGEYRVLAVCTANTCRSAMLKAALWQTIHASVNVTSIYLDSAGAGKPALIKQPANTNAFALYPAELAGHVSSSITQKDLKSFHLILTMTQKHRSLVLTECEGQASHTGGTLLTAGTSRGGCDPDRVWVFPGELEDPWGKGIDVYAAASCKLRGWTSDIISELPGGGKNAIGWNPKKWHQYPLPERPQGKEGTSPSGLAEASPEGQGAPQRFPDVTEFPSDLITF